MSLTHLLFPVASAVEAQEGLHSVVRVAKALTAKLTLLRVVDPFRDGGPRPLREEATALGAMRFGLGEQQVRLEGNSDIAAGVLQFTKTEKVDAIVLPQRKRSWIEGHSGSAELVQRLSGESSCPIWLTSEDDESDSPLRVRRILCAISGHDHKVLESASRLCDQFRAELFVMHVVPEIHEGLLAYGFDQHVALSAANGVELLANMQRTCGTNGQPIVEVGEKDRCISRAAKSLRVDVVVTGREIRTRKGAMARLMQAIAPRAPRVACQTLMI